MTRRSRPLRPSRPPTEARTGLIAIILVSSLAFLLIQARKDIVNTLALQEARLGIQFATVAAQPEIARLRALLDDPGRPETAGNFPPLPGQATLAVPADLNAEQRDASLALLGVNALRSDDTAGRFVIRNGQLFAALRNGEVAVMTSAPLFAPAAGLLRRLGIDIACVLFLGSLMLLVRESRMSDYSVRRLLDASPVPLIVLDADGRAEFGNRPALEAFGAGTATLEGVNDGLARQRELLPWLIGDAPAGDAIETRAFEIRMGEEPPRHFLVSRQRLLMRARRRVIASAVDITVRHEAERALYRAKTAAEELGRMKAESLAMISHELRTPVGGVLGLAQLLARQPLPEAATRIVNRLVQASRTLGAIIDDVVDLALIEVRRLRLEEKPFDPRETITAAVALASAAAPEKGLRVRVSVLSPLPPRVLGDPARLQQILINLVGNGIKFTEAGGVDVTVDVAAMTDGRVELAIEVRDTGIGIAADTLPRLFQAFSQAETGRDRRYQGTGLGLAITRAITDAMSGSVAVESEPGRGSVFRVRLPFAIARQVAPPAPAEIGTVRVLVVDDVALNRDLAADLLAAEGCEVTTAGSAAEAIAAVEAGRFDLVLMDVRMPRVDGLAATRALRAERGPRRHAGPILGLTANPAPTDAPLYRLAGLDGIVEKPLDADRLREALSRLKESAPAPVPAERPERLDRLARSLGEDRVDRILSAFREVADTAMTAIADACSRLDPLAVREAAHRLSGAASNLGFDALSAAADRLQELAEADDALAIADAATALVAPYRMALAALDAPAEAV